MSERVSNESFREAFERSNLSAAEVARACGWFRKDGQADGPRVMRAVGLSPVTDQKGVPKYRKSMAYEMAVVMAEALKLDPHEVGI